ncbi:protein C9orf135 [Xenopus laevis]|uniref:Uncharacterized protein n=2 Tax=Xenopus laevis TaxID=8355 RepID=A0A974DVN0_XENLA|nr:protein C9orf135 [Xenopus laevis]OCT97866.1 hypothetical protein XELAEV_18010098mg [Xenopus laevis]
MSLYAMPDLYERKGSLYLRSNHVTYGRTTLVSGWHQNREAEPKDYDLDTLPLGKKNLCHSTYRSLGKVETTDWKTTTEEQLSQVQLKKDYEARDVPKSMVNENTIDAVDVYRQTGSYERGSVLPRHDKDHGKIHLETTYHNDYSFPFQPTMIPHAPECPAAYKKCHSQFTDTADYRRDGRNTWQDESGIYGNHQIKHSIFKKSCPITPHL